MPTTPGTEMDISYGPSGYKGLFQAPAVLALSAIASLGGVLFGYDQGVISGVLVMTDFEKKFPTLASSSTMEGWMVSVLTLGAMVGSLINGPVSDRLSRRWSILAAVGVFLIGSAIQAGAVAVPMIFVGRAIAGLSIGMLSMVVPLYLSEVAPPNLRGGLVSLQQLGITAGIMVAFWIDYGTNYIGGTGDSQSQASWRLPLSLQCVPAIGLGLGTLILPYSPRWLMMKDREEEAAQTLSRIRRLPLSDWRIQRELLEIKAASIFDKESVKSRFPGVTSTIKLQCLQFLELVTVPHLSKRLLISCLLQIIQQFTGINAIIYWYVWHQFSYAPTIFEDIGLTGNSVNLLATGVVGIIDFLSTIPAILYLDRWGRRKLLMAGAVGMGVSQLIVATLYAVYEKSWTAHKSAGWAAAVFVWIYISFFAVSIGCVNWVVPSELFPPAYRAKAVGIAIGTNWLSNFIVALILPRMLKSIRFGTFYFFFVFCVILFVWVFFFVPETRGVRIEEMDKLFGGSEGEEDIERIQAIRESLGLVVRTETDKKEHLANQEHIE